ncbi:MAG: guanylate kinase [Deltaproteobacteria bacterium]|nr:guanylate kinase [Deltaproteobacteria bacterium]
MPGEIFIISAPSGAGKSTLIRALLQGDPRLRFSISCTTRPPRPGETPGQDYFFVSSQVFREMIAGNLLVEWVEQFGHFYGTSREWVESTLAADYDLVFDLEPRGARRLRSQFPEAVSIFILPPDPEALEARLSGRPGGLDAAELVVRLEQGRRELEAAGWYDFLVINDELPQALAHLQAIITATRCRTARLWPLLAPRYRL